MAINTRPISKRSNIAKCAEPIITSGMKSRLNVAKFYNTLQHGFLEGKSTKANPMEYLLKIQMELSNDIPCDIVYFDFQKCFDRINHEVLLKKIKKAGISGNIGRWLENFSKNRVQCVKVGNSTSAYHQVKSSVVQGSVIGPAAFLIMINDLPSIFSAQTSRYFFADHFKLLMPITSGAISANALQHQINLAYKWSIENQLPFNAQKCEVLHLGLNNPGFAYTIGMNFI